MSSVFQSRSKNILQQGFFSKYRPYQHIQFRQIYYIVHRVMLNHAGFSRFP